VHQIKSAGEAMLRVSASKSDRAAVQQREYSLRSAGKPIIADWLVPSAPARCTGK